MRSDRPLPGNPWPHDMQITVDDRPDALLDLLWLRDAYGLAVGGDAPPPLSDGPAPAARTVTDEELARWAGDWPRVWDAVARHAGAGQDADLFRRLTGSAPGSAERAELLQRLVGPSWRDEFGGDAFDDPSYGEWRDRGGDAHRAAMPRSLAQSPEHRDVDALAHAWRKGLTTIVTIPCRGSFTRTLGPSGLLVTDETRADSHEYRRALGAFTG